MAYFQSFTNTYAPIDTLRRVYDDALSVEDIVGLSIGTRPDCVDGDILRLLEGYVKNGHTIWVEYGLQSACDSTLSLINRGHDVKSFTDAVAATKSRGIKICAHVILGLPGEARRHMLETADVVSNSGIDGIKIHLLYVIKGTALEKMYSEKRYQCLEQVEYAELVCDVLERLPKTMVIQRLTGDPHPEELAAPMWSLRKNDTLRMINDILETRNSYQGKYLNSQSP